MMRQAGRSSNRSAILIGGARGTLVIGLVLAKGTTVYEG